VSLRKSKRPRETWYIPKAINDVDRIIDAVIAIKDLDGCPWTETTSTSVGSQTELQRLIKEAGVYGGTPSDMAGRNWMATFQFFGFAYVERNERKKTVNITPVGKMLFDRDADRQEIVLRQFLKLQFPNPYQIRSMSPGIQIFPFQAVLKALKGVEYLSEYEIANYVLWLKNTSEIPALIDDILKSRKQKPTPRVKTDVLNLLRDYASRLRLYFTYTSLIEADHTIEHTLTLNTSKTPLIEKILSSDPEVRIKYADRNAWNEWFSHFGSTPKPYRLITGKLTATQYRARRFVEALERHAIEDKESKVRISLVEKETNLSFDEMNKMLDNKALHVQFPLLERVEIVANHIVITPITTRKKKPYIGLSNIVKGYAEIIPDSTHSDDYAKFEEDVTAIFKALQFKVEELGVSKSGRPMPDLIVKSEVGKDPGKYWACIVDAKSRTKGFDIGTGSRRAMAEYARNYSKTVSGANPFPLKALLYVSSYFKGNVDQKLVDLASQTETKSACISADKLLYLLDVYLNHPGKVTHEGILALLTCGTEVTKQMIDAIVS